MMHWYFDIVGQFLHAVFHQPVYDDGHQASFSSTYDILTTVLGAFGLVALVVWGITSDGLWGVMRRLPLLAAWLLWPFVLVTLVPVLALALPVLMVYSYVRLLPDKQTRIQRARDRTRELAGKISDVRGL